MNKKARIKQFILEEIVAESNPGTTDFDDNEVLTDSGILDSLGMLRLVAFLDEEMETDIMSQRFSLEDFRTLDRICQWVDEAGPVSEDAVADSATGQDQGQSRPADSRAAESTPQQVTAAGLDPGLSGKVAVVTGASRGVGAMIARVLGIYGCKVVVNYYSSADKAEAVVDDIESQGGSAMAIRADVSDPGQVIAMFQQVEEAWGTTEILVNNAVRDFDAHKFLDVEWPEVQESMSVAVRGTFNCCKAAIPGMLESGGGKIINIGTLGTDAPAPNQLKYVLSKSALVGLTRSLAVDYAGQNIRVNMVCPSVIETDLVSHMPKTYLDKLGQDTPMQRNATTTDVAQAVIFLASDHSSFVTGQRLMVTGGQTPFL